MAKTIISLIALVTLSFSVVTVAQDSDDSGSEEEFRSIDQEVQMLKKVNSSTRRPPNRWLAKCATATKATAPVSWARL